MDMIKGTLVKSGGTYRGTNRLYVRIKDKRYIKKMNMMSVRPIVDNIYMFKVNGGDTKRYTPTGLNFVGPEAIGSKIKLFLLVDSGPSVDRYVLEDDTKSFLGTSKNLKDHTLRAHVKSSSKTVLFSVVS